MKGSQGAWMVGLGLLAVQLGGAIGFHRGGEAVAPGDLVSVSWVQNAAELRVMRRDGAPFVAAAAVGAVVAVLGAIQLAKPRSR